MQRSRSPLPLQSRLIMPDSIAPDEALQSLGARLRYAREMRGYTLAQCAQRSGIALRRLRSYEADEADPSLPELEALAYVLNVSVQALAGESPLQFAQAAAAENLAQWKALRHQLIGARLKQARLARNESIKQAAQAAGLKPAQLSRFESGQPVPLPVLQQLAAHYGLRLTQLLDLGVGQIGEAQLQTWQCEQFAQLEPSLRAFVAQSGAAPFLEVARRLSMLPAASLGAFVHALAQLASLAGSASSEADR